VLAEKTDGQVQSVIELVQTQQGKGMEVQIRTNKPMTITVTTHHLNIGIAEWNPFGPWMHVCVVLCCHV